MMPKVRRFPYAERAERFRRAQKALDDAWRHPLFEGRESALEGFWSAAGNTLPPEFNDACAQVKAGDAAGVEMLIEFLEADPYFFRSGYLKADVIHYLHRVVLTEAQRERLRLVVIHVVSTRDGREFRRYCRLARLVNSPTLGERIEQLAASPEAAVRRRAQWVLAALRETSGPPQPLAASN